jgi:hypothetical protein
MSNQPNDPAQYLAGLFAASQNLMRQFAASVPGASTEPGADLATAFMASSKNFAEMQQDHLKQITGVWCGMLGAAVPSKPR